MQHIVTITMSGMPGKRGPRRFVGTANNCRTALARAVASMPEETRKAWWRAEWDATNDRMVAGFRKFAIKDTHKALA